MAKERRRSCIAILATVLGCALGFSGCGQTPARTMVARVAPGPIPHIQTLSPNSGTQAGPGFTLSIVGSQFFPNSTVYWSGKALATQVVNSNLLTAQIPATLLGGAQSSIVWVQGPGQFPAKSNPVTFSIPCPVASLAPASMQTRARLGAYYFDGWSGSLTSPPFNGMPFGQYEDHEPLTGWQDKSACAVEQQLALGRNFGFDFFVFDWYFDSQRNYRGENLNSALQVTHALPDRHGMQYAILYVNSPPFIVAPQNWNSAIVEWMGYMSDPDYVTVNGKPLLVIYDMQSMRQTFGSSEGVAQAFTQLRAAAAAHGLAGVYIAGGFYGSYDPSTGTGNFPDLSESVGDGYDAITMYNYSAAGQDDERPFSTLSQTGQWLWNQAPQKSPLPFVPVAMDGWDARPWNEAGGWYQRTPQDVADFVDSAIVWANTYPDLRPEPAPIPPLVLVEAWNELGEGSYMVPTVTDGTSYGDALATALLK